MNKVPNLLLIKAIIDDLQLDGSYETFIQVSDWLDTQSFSNVERQNIAFISNKFLISQGKYYFHIG
jgi:hypothetical protein